MELLTDSALVVARPEQLLWVHRRDDVGVLRTALVRQERLIATGREAV